MAVCISRRVVLQDVKPIVYRRGDVLTMPMRRKYERIEMHPKVKHTHTHTRTHAHTHTHANAQTHAHIHTHGKHTHTRTQSNVKNSITVSNHLQ